MRERGSVGRRRGGPDELVGIPDRRSAWSLGRSQRFDRFRLTSRFLRWEDSNRNCPYDLISEPPLNKPRSAAGRYRGGRPPRRTPAPRPAIPPPTAPPPRTTPALAAP